MTRLSTVIAACVLLATLSIAAINARQHSQLLALAEEQGRALAELQSSTERLARLVGDAEWRAVGGTAPSPVAAAATTASAPLHPEPPLQPEPDTATTEGNQEAAARAEAILQKALAGADWTQAEADEFRAAANASGPRAQDLLTKFGVALGSQKIHGNFHP